MWVSHLLTLGAVVVLSSLTLDPMLQALVDTRSSRAIVQGDDSAKIARSSHMDGGVSMNKVGACEFPNRVETIKLVVPVQIERP